MEPIGRLRSGETVALLRELTSVLLERRVLVLGHEHVSYAMLRRDVVVKLLVEHDRGRVQVGVQPLVLCWQIIILLFIHLFIDNILLSNTQRATSALLVNLRSSSCRLNACF